MKSKKGTKKELSRRDFIKTTAVGVGATALAGLGASAEAQAQELEIGAGGIPAKWDKEADVVVVGCGGAGASAAIAAHDAGVKVLILEKMPKGLEGGNTFASGGMNTWPYDKAKAVDHIYALCMGDTDNPTTPIELVRDWVDTMAGLLDVWKELGITPISPVYDYSHFFVSEPPNIAGPGSLHQSGLVRYNPRYEGASELTSGRALWRAYSDSIAKRGIEVMYETPAKELIQNPKTKEILGVKAESQGWDHYIKAKRGVVMALGGFENSPELQSWFYNPGIRVYPAGTPGNTGDGVKMVQQVGAVLWHMCAAEFSGVGILIPSRFIASPWPPGVDSVASISVGVASSYIIVNKYGKRFTNNISYGLSHTKRHDLTGFSDYFYFDGQSDDPTSKSEYSNSPCYIVFDESYRVTRTVLGSSFATLKGLYTPSRDNSKEIENGIITKADTIKELAAKLKIDPEGLEETVSKYNGYCALGNDPEFGVPARGLIPVKTPPYYGARLHARYLNTQGGAKRNGKAQIVDMYDKPIPRLYSAGEFGSIYGAMYHGSGNNAESATVGRLAGRNAAAELPWS